MSVDVAAAPAPSGGAVERPRSAAGLLTAAVMVGVPLLLWFAPISPNPTTRHALAISAFALIGWITRALEHAITGLIACYLAWALGVTKFDVAFSGFANSTSWFLFGAMLFGVMATKSGLARRVAYVVMRAVGDTYARILLGLIISDFLLTALVPSGVARVVILATVAIGLIEAFGLDKGSNVGRGMFIILVYNATIFDKMIIAGAASITARGLIERVGGVQVLWSQWALAYLPCDLITIFAGWRLTLWLYPPEKSKLPGGVAMLSDEISRMGPLTPLEKKTAVLMGLAILLWATDFVHHIPAPMIGLGVALLATLPRIGVLSTDDVRRLNVMPVFFVAASIGVSEIMRTTGGLDIVTRLTFGWVEPFVQNVWSSTVFLYWSAFAYHLALADEVGMIATSIPVLMQFAKSHGIDPLAVGLVWTFGAGGKVFVYESAVLVVGYSYGYFTARDMFVMGLLLTIVESLILLLLVPLYWPLIGI